METILKKARLIRHPASRMTTPCTPNLHRVAWFEQPGDRSSVPAPFQPKWSKQFRRKYHQLTLPTPIDSTARCLQASIRDFFSKKYDDRTKREVNKKRLRIDQLEQNKFPSPAFSALHRSFRASSASASCARFVAKNQLQFAVTSGIRTD